MTKEAFIYQYWNYYLILEREFLDTIKYLSIDVDNFQSFSIEYSKILQTVCSEIDVLCKKYCSYLDSSSDTNSILEYAIIIATKKPELKQQEVFLNKYREIRFVP